MKTRQLCCMVLVLLLTTAGFTQGGKSPKVMATGKKHFPAVALQVDPTAKQRGGSSYSTVDFLINDATATSAMSVVEQRLTKVLKDLGLVPNPVSYMQDDRVMVSGVLFTHDERPFLEYRVADQKSFQRLIKMFGMIDLDGPVKISGKASQIVLRFGFSPNFGGSPNSGVSKGVAFLRTMWRFDLVGTIHDPREKASIPFEQQVSSSWFVNLSRLNSLLQTRLVEEEEKNTDFRVIFQNSVLLNYQQHGSMKMLPGYVNVSGQWMVERASMPHGGYPTKLVLDLKQEGSKITGTSTDEKNDGTKIVSRIEGRVTFYGVHLEEFLDPPDPGSQPPVVSWRTLRLNWLTFNRELGSGGFGVEHELDGEWNERFDEKLGYIPQMGINFTGPATKSAHMRNQQIQQPHNEGKSAELNDPLYSSREKGNLMVAISPDQKFGVSYDPSKGITLFTPGSNVVIKDSIPAPDLVTGIAFSLDGTWFAVTGAGNTRFWSTKDGSKIVLPVDEAVATRYPVFAEDGKHFLALSLKSMVKVWDFQQGKFLGNIPSKDRHTYFSFGGRMQGLDEARCFTVNRDSKYVVIGYEDGEIVTYSMDKGKEIKSFRVLEDGVIYVAQLSNPDHFVAVSELGKVIVFKYDSGKVISQQAATSNPVIAVVLDKGTQRLWIQDSKKTLRVLDVSTGRILGESLQVLNLAGAMVPNSPYDVAIYSVKGERQIVKPD